jgi:hypothetical protein
MKWCLKALRPHANYRMRAKQTFASIHLIFLLFAVSVPAIHAQDVITRKNGDKIKAKVLEVGIDDVTYTRTGNDSGDTCILAISKILMIRYENGEEDVFEKTPDVNNPPKENPPLITEGDVAGDPKPKQTPGDRQEKPSGRAGRKGYVGAGIGGAGMMENGRYAGSGMQLNLHFGYLFSKHAGIAASILNTNFGIDDADDTSVRLSGIFAGPLLSTATASRRIEFDIKPMIGLILETNTFENPSDNNGETVFSYGIGGSVRWNCSSRIAVSCNLDYYHGVIHDYNVASAGISIGINFRF